MLLKEIVYFILPLLLTSVIHHFIVIRYHLFSTLAYPVDFSQKLFKQPLFGKTKTFRGFIVLILVNGLLTWLFSYLFPDIKFNINALYAGMVLGFGYALGEIPNSFLKRRFLIKESAKGKGILGGFFSFFDHFDSVLGATIALFFIYKVNIQLFISLILIGGLIHYLVDLVLYQIGYKRLLKKPF